MGQIFHACAFDIENKTCCVMDVDKFHANCYAHSGAVCSLHYLLRQKPHRVMWAGYYVLLNDNLGCISRIEDLLGFSTFLTTDDLDHEKLRKKGYDYKIKFIRENIGTWKEVSVWDEALKYCDWKKNRSVRRDGFLLNHTTKKAVNLADYYAQSSYSGKNEFMMSVDALPVLTETGGGTAMLLFNGVPNKFTEKFVGVWRSDLLQITDGLPDDYTLLKCCFPFK